MGSADIERKAVWEDGDATCMARVVLDGSNITQAVISSINREVYDLDSATPATSIDSSTPSVASTVFNTLQTDSRWTKDSTGYNFRNTVAGSLLSTGCHRYRIEYKLTGSGGEILFVVFELAAIPVYSS